MVIEKVTIQNFRCFGPEPTEVLLAGGLTVLIGDNGSGKTALLLALHRMLGSGRQPIVRQDFHVPAGEVGEPDQRTFRIELELAFPELEDEEADHSAVPDFFHQMGSTENGMLSCRLRLDATLVNDGTQDGLIEYEYQVVLPPVPGTQDEKLLKFRAEDRAHLRMVYVPAVRDGRSYLTSFLRGPLWRAMRWSPDFKQELDRTGGALNSAFLAEAGVAKMSRAAEERWRGLYQGGTDSTPILAPVDRRLSEFVRGVQVSFHPDESGGDRPLSELSDGQRSLFHISMTAATLDVEAGVTPEDAAFDADQLAKPLLTLVAIEEPENNLSPFYLSRIIRQVQDISARSDVQAIVSSHSASVLSRIDPSQVRHFRLDQTVRSAQVKGIAVPPDADEAAKYVREAVRAYPELYFASFVILGEGSSEEIVIPRIAEAMGVGIERSFVAVVPLGGRHVHHLWRLLSGLDIPHATLLDLDNGRSGGGWGRVRDVCRQLLEHRTSAEALFAEEAQDKDEDALIKSLDSSTGKTDADLEDWCSRLRRFDVFFCEPLDLDMAMLLALPDLYRCLEDGNRGPQERGDARRAVLGGSGDSNLYQGDDWNESFAWYRYLFLGRGKPTTHVRALAGAADEQLAAAAPEALRSLVHHIGQQLLPVPPPAATSASGQGPEETGAA